MARPHRPHEASQEVLPLLFLAQRLLFTPRPDSPPPPRWLGAILTVTAGFNSFVAHAGDPPISAHVIPLLTGIKLPWDGTS